MGLERPSLDKTTMCPDKWQLFERRPVNHYKMMGVLEMTMGHLDQVKVATLG